jgi:hypothetical protein
MIVLIRSDGCRKVYPDCIDSLEDALQITSPRDFADENRRQTFIAEFLMDTEEVDLRRMFSAAWKITLSRCLIASSRQCSQRSDPKSYGNSRYEGHETLRCGHTNTDMPILDETRRHERPKETVSLDPIHSLRLYG